MKIDDINKRVLELADGKYCSVGYSIHNHPSLGALTVTCKIYIEDNDHFESANFDTSLAMAEAAIQGPKSHPSESDKPEG